MNRTIEQWAKVDCKHAAYNGGPSYVAGMLADAVSDIKRLARQLETERAAWSAKRTELLRNHDAELARRKAAEQQRDYALSELEFIASTDSLDAVLDPDRAIRVAKAAVKFIKEQTK